MFQMELKIPYFTIERYVFSYQEPFKLINKTLQKNLS